MLLLPSLLIISTISAVYSAPAILSQQYILITPQSQLQLEPALKLQQPILQPISQYKTVKVNGRDGEVLIYLPNSPLVQYPTILPYRDDGNIFSWDGILAAIQDYFTGTDDDGSTTTQAPDAAAKTDMKSQKLEFENDAETITPEQPNLFQTPLVPQPPSVAFPPGAHRFFVLGAPQFYGNFAGLTDPSNPLYRFQTLQPLLTNARSAVSDISAETQSESISKPIADNQLNEQILEEPQARFQSDNPITLNQKNIVELENTEKKIVNAETSENESLEGQVKNVKDSDEPSIAKAGPVGLALAGNGGIASSQPVATALVGKGGLALASPSATSVAGDFLGDGF